MKFEHLIQINDAYNPLVLPLTRSQIWDGLMQRVENPLPFLPGLENCTIIERESTRIRRRLSFGSSCLEDQVFINLGHWVRFDIESSACHARGSLTIHIEEPRPDALFLRFSYQTNLGENGSTGDLAYIEYIKSAYHQSDIDTVRLIRIFATENTLVLPKSP